MKAIVRTAAAAALALVFAAPLLGQATLLRMVPAEGLVSRYVIGSETHMESAMGPSDTPVATTRTHQTETIVNVAGDAIEILTAVDSSTATAMPGAADAPDLAGMSYTVGMDPRARVTELTDTGTLTPAGENFVLQTLGTRFFELPEAEVSPGDSWSGQTEVEIPTDMGTTMTMEGDVTYTLASLEGGLAEISLAGAVTMTVDLGGMTMAGTGDISGTAIFDTDKSRLQSHETVTSLDIDAGGMQVTMKVSTTLELVP